jgi:hypothetical protein
MFQFFSSTGFALFSKGNKLSKSCFEMVISGMGQTLGLLFGKPLRKYRLISPLLQTGR